MPRIDVIDRKGTEHSIEARSGFTLMESLRDHPWGVEAICGGVCSCATCHVYIDPAWAGRLAPPDESERQLLDSLAKTNEHSRLACQVACSDDLEGLKLSIAPEEW